MVLGFDHDPVALGRDVMPDRLDDRRVEPGLQRTCADLAVPGVAPVAGAAEDVAEVVEQAGEHELVAFALTRRQRRRLQGVVEHRDPLAVRLGGGRLEPFEEQIDDR